MDALALWEMKFGMLLLAFALTSRGVVRPDSSANVVPTVWKILLSGVVGRRPGKGQGPHYKD